MLFTAGSVVIYCWICHNCKWVYWKTIEFYFRNQSGLGGGICGRGFSGAANQDIAFAAATKTVRFQIQTDGDCVGSVTLGEARFISGNAVHNAKVFSEKILILDSEYVG